MTYALLFLSIFTSLIFKNTLIFKPLFIGLNTISALFLLKNKKKPVLIFINLVFIIKALFLV